MRPRRVGPRTDSTQSTVKYVELSDDFADAKKTTPYVQLSMYPHTDRSIAPQNYGYQVCEYEFNSPVCETPETPEEWPEWILPYTECEAGPEGGTRAIISKNYTVAQDLLLIHFQGHMHNGGLVLELFANGTEPEDLLCASKARYGTGANDTGSKGFLVELGECLWEEGLPVSAGTELIVKSTYVATPADQIADDPGAAQIAFGAPFDGVMAYGMLQAVPASGEIEGFLLEPDAPPSASTRTSSPSTAALTTRPSARSSVSSRPATQRSPSPAPTSRRRRARAPLCTSWCTRLTWRRTSSTGCSTSWGSIRRGWASGSTPPARLA